MNNKQVWIVACNKGSFEVLAEDQWDAWEQICRGDPLRIGMAVSAKRLGDTEDEMITVRGVDLAFKYGEFDIAKKLDELAVSEGLPSMWQQLMDEATTESSPGGKVRVLGAKQNEGSGDRADSTDHHRGGQGAAS